jgi:hypothetical protein
MAQSKSTAALHTGPALPPGLNGGVTAKPEYDRRLSDKILAAFNHAYASGAHKVADRLRNVLADVEQVERAKHDRRAASAVSQADLWVAFIEARNGYNDLVSKSDTSADKVEEALETMKSAYRVWADS